MKRPLPYKTPIDTSSVLFLKKYLFHRLRDAGIARKERVKHSIYYDITWACASEAALITFRLGLITPATYMRMRRYLNKLDEEKLS